MKTIEERAREYATKLVGGWYEGGLKGNMWDTLYSRYLEIATEQDQITRQEEKERCIDIAKEHICGMCGYSECEFGMCSQYNNIEQCEAIINLRKAIEGNNNG